VQTEPYETARFKEVFTKLHAFNPAVLPYDRVVFLDLDMIVLRNVDALFELRTPAAMQNFKMRNQRPKQQLNHGDRIDVSCTHFNAGTMVLAPSRALFDLLVEDVQEPDPTWHQTGYSPEQKYLSLILDGQWTHVSQLYNFEVQFHPGVPLTTLWQQTPASRICIAHYSGKKKVWDASPEYCAPVNGSSWSREIFEALPDTVRKSAAARCNLLHAEWQRVLARAWRECRASLNGDAVAVGEIWGAALVAGELNSPRADFTGAPWPLPGDSAASNLNSGEQMLLEVLRQRDQLLVCRYR
jgi:lipopolysaccharide biosynthesis glycosyltransferase